jgi:hypothetical protein
MVTRARLTESPAPNLGPVCTENPIRIDGAMESPKLVE